MHMLFYLLFYLESLERRNWLASAMERCFWAQVEECSLQRLFPSNIKNMYWELGCAKITYV